MKMNVLDGGRVRMRRRIFVPDAAKEEQIEMPVIATLFRHPKGNVLFDTGCHPSVETDAEARWGGLARLMTPIAPPGTSVVAALAQVGLQPDDIDIVVNSHLHPDHCGCNCFFRKAEFFCHAAELEAAEAEGADAQGYRRVEWDLPMRLDALAGSHDVFGDGRLVTVPLPGHTPGCMGLRAELAGDGVFLLASDAVTLKRNLDRDEVPMNAWDRAQLLASYETVRAEEARGATVICGHDDDQWRTLRTGRDGYE